MWVLTYPVSVVCYILSVLNAIGGLFAPAVPSVFFCVSGGIAIGGAQSGNKGLVVATRVMSIVFALLALALLMFVTFWVFSVLDRLWLQGWAVLPILLLLSMVIVPTISACLACKALRSQKRPSEEIVQTNQTHYHPNQVCNQPNQVSNQSKKV